MEYRSLSSPRGGHHPSRPKGSSRDRERAVTPPAPIQPQASHFAAAAHKTTVGLGARANIPRGFASQAGSRCPRSRRGPAGEGKAGGSGTELPPPAWSRHVAAAPLGTAEKVRQEPGSPGGGEKVRRPHPHPLFQDLHRRLITFDDAYKQHGAPFRN